MSSNKKLSLDIQELPRRPQRPVSNDRGRSRFALCFIAALALGAGGFWLLRDPELRESVSAKAEAMGGALSGAENVAKDLTAKAKQLLGATPVPPVGQSGTSVPGAPSASTAGGQGTSVSPGGNEGAATGDAGGNLANAPAGAAEPSLEGGASERGAVASAPESPSAPVGRTDDAVVKIAFIVDLAKWMVEGYQPSANGRTGTLTVGVQGANLRYGAGMRGLSWIGEDLPAGRTEAIRYVYTPGMLDGLFKLYIGRFMDEIAGAVEEAAPAGKALTAAQKSDLYRAYAKRFRGLSGALQSVGALKDFGGRMEGFKQASQNVVDANARYSELVFELDNATELKQTANLSSLNSRVQSAGQAYQQAVIKREQVREALLASLRQNPSARLLDDETLLFVAHWVERRVRGERPDTAIDATLQAATLFLDLASRFELAAGTLS